jgi:uncharacterized protein (TIGR02001 family)
MSKAGGWLAFPVVFGLAGGLQAQTQIQGQTRAQSPTQAPAETPAQKSDLWAAPFGGTWSARLTAMSDYSYRGISLTERQPAVQARVSYTRPIVPETLDLVLEVWGGNVRFAPQVSTELTASASLVLHGFDNRLAIWFSFSRYSYPESAPELKYNYNEFYLWAGYDFGVLQLAGTLAYAPNYYADGGAAWYKSVETTVPLGFLPFGREIGLKAFASLGNQYIERYFTNGYLSDNYWDWEIGLRARFWQVDVALSYIDTNLDPAGCSNSCNCEARVVIKMSKTF